MTPARVKTTDPKAVLTTGQVAEICHVAPRTVSKWFDTGKLRGYRIPGSRDRRIPMDQLLAFMRTHGIPLDGLDRGTCRVLMVDDDSGDFARLARLLEDTGRYQLRGATNDFEAGAVAQQFRPHVIVIDVDNAGKESADICRKIKAIPALQSARIIAMSEDPGDRRRAELADMGFDACVATSCSPGDFMRTIEEATDIIT